MSTLSSLESQVLEVAFAGEGAALAALREQATDCEVISREHSGVGFFAQVAVADDRARLSGSATIGGIFAEIEGLTNGAGFVVFVESGRIHSIEGFTYDEPWPAQARIVRLFPPSVAPDISSLRLVGKA